MTADGSLSAHYENTILITAAGPEFLSVTEEEERQLNQIAAAQPMVKCKNPILKVNEWRNGNVKSRCN